MNSARSSCARKVRALNHFWMLYTLLCLSVLPPWTVVARNLCGDELVDALTFICGDRGFYGGEKPPASFGKRMLLKGIVEKCCFKHCGIDTLERYCAYPKPRSMSLLPTGRHQDEYLDKKSFNSANWISKLLQKKMIPESEDSNRSKHASRGLSPSQSQ